VVDPTKVLVGPTTENQFNTVRSGVYLWPALRFQRDALAMEKPAKGEIVADRIDSHARIVTLVSVNNKDHSCA